MPVCDLEFDMASGELRAFFSGLAADHEQLAEFLLRPDAVLDASGLDAADKAAVLNPDPDVLRERLRDPHLAYIVIVIIAVLPGEPDLDQRAVVAARVAAEPPSPQVVAETFGRAFGEAFAQALGRVLGIDPPRDPDR